MSKIKRIQWISQKYIFVYIPKLSSEHFSTINMARKIN